MVTAEHEQGYTPFAPTLEPVAFFDGAGRRELLDGMFDAVDSGAAVCLLTGSNGTGKSALVSQLVGRFEHVADVLFLPQPRLPVVELVQALAVQLGLEDAPTQSAESAEKALIATLQKRRAEGRRTVVVIEEAQCAASATLRSLHRMCQSGGDNPWLQLLVFADADAEGTEALPRLLTPVSTVLEMPALDATDVKAYCNQQLAFAGWDEAHWIDDATASALHRVSNGSIRRLNLLASAAVERAATEGEQSLDADRLQQVVRDFGLATARFELPTLSFDVRALLKSIAVPTVSRRVVVPVAAFMLLGATTLALTSLLRDASENVVVVEAVPVPAAVQEPRMVTATPTTLDAPLESGVQPAVPVETQISALPAQDADIEPVVAEVVAPEAENAGDRRLGDPRVSLLGSAIAGLANRVSSAGDGAFALRTTGTTPSVLQLVKRVDPLDFVLGQRAPTPPALSTVPRTNVLGNPADAIDDWFLQSTNWLDTEPEDRYSIQLLLVSRDSEKLRDFLGQLPASVDKGSLYAFPTERDGRELMLVVFGNYSDADAARSAIGDLPRSLRRLQPFVRSLGSLRTVVESI